MNVNRQLKLATSLGDFWNHIITDIGTPEHSQFLLWAGMYTEPQIVQGINRAARKALKLKNTATPMTLTEAVQYASSVMKNEKLGWRNFSGSRTQQTEKGQCNSNSKQ